MDESVFPRSSRAFHWAALFVAFAAFALYLFSALHLAERGATRHFGADSWHYALLAEGDLSQQLKDSPEVIRITRFHPLTVALASLWMEALDPLSPWIDEENLLKAFFAAVAAAAVWATIQALSSVVSKSYALLAGVIYALTASVWYFASIEESKIVSAALGALYIAIYLNLRKQWTPGRALLLTAVLFLACLNEIVSGLLVLVPLIDTFIRQDRNLRGLQWIAAHSLVVPAALLFLEWFVGGYLLGYESGKAGGSHIAMFFYYVLNSNHDLGRLYSVFLNWFLFSLAAPSPYADYMAVQPYGGYFQVSFLKYFRAPWAAAAILLWLALLVISLLKNFRGGLWNETGLLLALLAYTASRAAFFFVFNPDESFLFSAPAVLPNLMLVLVPVCVSRLPAKQYLLGGFALLLLITNGLFILNA